MTTKSSHLFYEGLTIKPVQGNFECLRERRSLRVLTRKYMNTDKLILMLDDYLQILQEQNADDKEITDVKLMVWAIQQDVKLQRFLNNLTLSNSYYRR